MKSMKPEEPQAKKERGEENRFFNKYLLPSCRVAGTELDSEDIVVNEDKLPVLNKVCIQMVCIKMNYKCAWCHGGEVVQVAHTIGDY